MENKKLYRTKENKIIGGVSGGLAEYFNIDITIIRISFIFLLFFNGAGALIYLLLMIFVPEKSEVGDEPNKQTENMKKFVDEVGEKVEDIAEKVKKNNSEASGNHGRNVFGFFLIFIGLLIFLNQVYPQFIDFDLFWPILLVILGFFILIRRK